MLPALSICFSHICATPGDATWLQNALVRSLHFRARLLFCHALLEHLGEVDRIDHQRRKSTVARRFRDDLPCKRKENTGAFDEQQRQHMLLRETFYAKHASIDQ